MTHIVSGAIPEWHKQYKARKPYHCDNCGSVIPTGTLYNCYVLRYGNVKGKDPLRKAHVHLDCTAPWYQPDAATHYLRSLGRMKPAPQEVAQTPAFAPSLYLHAPQVGTLQWQLPSAVTAQLQSSPYGISALAEMHTVVGVLLRALTTSAGNPKRAMQLNNLVVQMTDLLEHNQTQ